MAVSSHRFWAASVLSLFVAAAAVAQDNGSTFRTVDPIGIPNGRILGCRNDADERLSRPTGTLCEALRERERRKCRGILRPAGARYAAYPHRDGSKPIVQPGGIAGPDPKPSGEQQGQLPTQPGTTPDVAKQAAEPPNGSPDTSGGAKERSSAPPDSGAASAGTGSPSDETSKE